MSKTVDGETVFYLRTPSGNTFAEYDQDSNLIAEYIYAGDRQVAKVEPDGLGGEDISFFHPDHLGTSLHITDEQGNTTWSGDYYPFGAEFSSTGTPDRYRFTQHELDPATSLTYAKARYYNPAIGRFISTDPVGGSTTSSQSWNSYSYAKNSPLKYTDPDGRFPWLFIPILVGAIAGAEYANAPEGPDDPTATALETQNSGHAMFEGSAVGAAVAGVADVVLDRLVPSHDPAPGVDPIPEPQPCFAAGTVVATENG